MKLITNDDDSEMGSSDDIVFVRKYLDKVRDKMVNQGAFELHHEMSVKLAGAGKGKQQTILENCQESMEILRKYERALGKKLDVPV